VAISVKTICAFCSSSDAVAPEYFDAARELGALFAQRGITLVYGGGNVGLMGALARSVHAGGGKVIGVIPSALRDLELAYTEADELIVTKDLRERKAIMESYADAFVALPGGYGTLEEMIEVLTLKQLRFHDKPLVFLNTAAFYSHLHAFFEHLYEHHFAKPKSRELYCFVDRPADVLECLDRWESTPAGTKWY
jgi:hypothetical protein